VLLTWQDIVDVADDLDHDMRVLLLQIAKAKDTTSVTSVTTAEGPWFVKDIVVQGHVGIGEEPVRLDFPAAPGLTVVSARNGTGKTSLADGMRHAISGGAKPKYDLLATNIHYPHRSVVVTLTNGQRDIRIAFGPDEAVRWRDDTGTEAPPPAEWTEAFARYMPVLLYPEISPVIEKPGNLHEFLKDALELAVLEELQRDLRLVRDAGSAAQRQVDTAHATALAGVRKVGNHDLVSLLDDHGSVPSEETCRGILSIASSLPSTAPQPLSLPDVWSIDEARKTAATEAIARLDAVRDTASAGADALLGVLSKLLADDASYVSDQREQDVCPVCRAPDRGWAEVAAREADRLRKSTGSLRAAQRAVVAALGRIGGFFPTALPAAARAALLGEDPTASIRISQWDRLVVAATALTPKATSVSAIELLLAESGELALWYAPIRGRLLGRRDEAVATQATVRTHVENWLNVLKDSQPAIDRLVIADRLNKKVDRWLRTTREDIFKPIGEQVKQLWSILNSDTDLKLTSIALAGGTVRQRKVQLALASGDLAIPAGNNNAAILSTGQRNALSLATYLPRATQPHSPFGFLILDDPIHVFDDWRVRYLAKHLIELAQRFQIVVFTHDDRLWRELRSLGAQATHTRLDRIGADKPQVRVKDITRPGEQMLRDLDKQLAGEACDPLGTEEAQTAMTLALCR
jgi:hypothetical protein